MIHRVRIQNFKSIFDVDVELSPVTVLVGRSGTGKSNFVEAIRFLRDALASQLERYNWTRLRPASAPTALASFDIEFSVSGMDDRFRYELTLSEKGPSAPPINERLSLGKHCLFHQSVSNASSKWMVEPSLATPPEAGPIALGRIPSITEVAIAFIVLTTKIGCYAFPNDVLGGRNGSGVAAGLDDSATNYLTTLRDIVSNLQDLNVRKGIVAALRRVNPSIASVELDDIQNPKRILVGHKFNGKTLALQLSQESDGFRRFYAHLLALYQRPPKQTLIFEHPEDGIHPGALSMLADEFKAAPRENRGQVILTTHSPMLLDQFSADQIRVVELQGSQTKIGPLASEQRESLQEKLLSAGELLTVDPARLQASATEATGP